MNKTYNFGEKTKEYSAKQKAELPVWKTPKYEISKQKAISLINEKKYNLSEGDFWILMNETKTGKMQYTGLIISHNACLKINDTLESKFSPSSVTVDKEGYNKSLVFTYSNEEQGLYEVGEVSNDNCRNDYKYAMGFKRLFDRVVLKLSKIAFDGIYSEAESDEFKQPDEIIEEINPDTDILLGLDATDTAENAHLYYKENVDNVKDVKAFQTAYKKKYLQLKNKELKKGK